jgi:Tfp pilus assembly protein PilF
VEGSVKRIGTKTRITARLVRARDQSQLWTGTYEGEADGKQIPAFQQSVASKVALALSVVLPESRVPVDGSSSQLAYEANLRGRYLLNRRNEDGFHLAIEFFQTAISLDPKYAQAYAGLADCYNLTLDYYERNSGRDLERQARSAAETAIALDPNSSEGHASLAFNLWRYGWKFSEADAEFRKALSLNFNNATAHHWYGLFLASRGRFDEAREELRQARQLDPLSMIIVTNVGWVDYFARDFDGAIANYQEALKLDPSFQTAHMKLAWSPGSAFTSRQDNRESPTTWAPCMRAGGIRARSAPSWRRRKRPTLDASTMTMRSPSYGRSSATPAKPLPAWNERAPAIADG